MIKRTLFFGNKCSLTTKYEQLVIKTELRETIVPIEDIGFVVIEHQESYISIPTLEKLVTNNVAVIFCDNKHMPNSMLLNLNSHHIQHEIFKNQINASEPLKKQLWQHPQFLGQKRSRERTYSYTIRVVLLTIKPNLPIALLEL